MCRQRAYRDERGWRAWPAQWLCFFFSSRRRHTRYWRDWSSDVCSSDLTQLRGRGAEARVTGAYATTGRQHIDFDTLQEHAAPDTTSDLAFRGVLAGRSKIGRASCRERV